MSDINTITESLLKFRNERDWEQFHNPKDLALAINVEAGELLELYLWKNAEEVNTDKIKEELADVFAYAFLLANKYQFDVKNIILDKIQKNAQKYPIEKAKGTAKKYNELEKAIEIQKQMDSFQEENDKRLLELLQQSETSDNDINNKSVSLEVIEEEVFEEQENED